MLETFVPSRVRRALFEHLLTHPDERFYLRGLAKQLGLSISPLRRELKRLERSGMLRAVQEGNMLFYIVDPASPDFVQLKQVGQQAEAPSEARLEASEPPAPLPTAHAGQAGSRQAILVGIVPADRRMAAWRSPLSGPALAGAAGAGVALLLLIAGLLYVSVTQQRLASQASRALATRRAEVTVVVPQVPSSSGAMRGSRWQIVPGGFGGFSSGSSSGDSY